MPEALVWFAYAVSGLVFVMVLVYVSVRAASFAHFRTKLEYFKAMLREVEKGGKNGKG